MKRFSHWGNSIILGSIILLIYSPALFSFFSQDDFTHLVIAQADSFQNVLDFFRFRAEGIYYRPLSIQLVTWLTRSVFGLRPFWFHIIALAGHVGAAFVVKKMIHKLTDNEDLGWWGAVFYGVHPIHFMSLFWWAEVSMVMAPLFSFLAILAWINKKYIKFSLWFGLALISNELAISVIPIALLLRQKLMKLIPVGLVAALVIGGRWLLAPPSLGTEYGLKFLPQVALTNLRWQVIRALGFPEGLTGQLQLPMTKLAGVLVGLAAVMLIGQTVRSKRLGSRFWLGAGWFVAALLPVLFLERHQSPIYGVIGLPGFFLMMSDWMKSSRWVMVWAILFTIGSLFAIRAMEQYHWVTQRAREAEYYVKKLQAKKIQDGDRVVFINNTKPESSLRAYFALGAGNGIKVFFGKNTESFFEDVTEVPLTSAKTHYVVSSF